MNVETARWLVGEGRSVLAEPIDPDSLAVAAALRRRFEPEQAAAVTQQLALRRKASAKFGDAAGELFFTADGLEQATRPVVSRWRARRFAEAGASRVVDLGCGIGADSLAMLAEGLEVRPVELDPVTAVFAEANLGVPVEVADATEVGIAPDDAVFCDPARRTARGRTWRVEDFTPPWDFVTGLLAGRVANLKLGPGVPYALLPDDAATTWVSDRGDVVEASVWTVGEPGSRSALLLPEGLTMSSGDMTPAPVAMPRPCDVVLEPDGALIRAGLVDHLAFLVGATRLSPGVAYLRVEQILLLDSENAPKGANFANEKEYLLNATSLFHVDEVLPYSEKVLRAWVREHDIGTLEIKKRGIDVDPAALRRRLKPTGRGSATLILTPTPEGARALVAHRGVVGN